MKMNFSWWWKVIKQYLKNCSIHGVKYLVDNQLSYIERLFWLIFCALSWYGCANMINNVLRNYVQYPVALTTETSYIDWKTPFPAVAFCISSTSTIRKLFKRNPGLFTNYSNPSFLRTSAADLLSAYEQLRVPCEDFLAECTWNNVKFNCCAEFHELKKTGVGYCIAMNTFHLTNNNGASNVHFFVNRTVKYGDLVIDIRVDAKMKKFLFAGFTVHVINNLQLPMFNNVEKEEIRIKAGKTTRVEIAMDDTYNEDGVKHVPIQHRNCRFSDETRENNLYDIYSSDSCYLEVIIERMIKFCGCVNFYYLVPQGTRVCNGIETLCIIANKTNIASQSVKNEQCLPNCGGTSLIVNRLEPYEYDSPNQEYARLQFTLLSHPTMRYRRYVVNDLLDVIGSLAVLSFVCGIGEGIGKICKDTSPDKRYNRPNMVSLSAPKIHQYNLSTADTIQFSIGSAIGLFTGASILSIFEIPYWLFVRRDKIID